VGPVQVDLERHHFFHLIILAKLVVTSFIPALPHPVPFTSGEDFVPDTYCLTWAWVWDGGSEGKETTFIWSI
jgi:hypothetical protein